MREFNSEEMESEIGRGRGVSKVRPEFDSDTVKNPILDVIVESLFRFLLIHK